MHTSQNLRGHRDLMRSPQASHSYVSSGLRFALSRDLTLSAAL